MSWGEPFIFALGDNVFLNFKAPAIAPERATALLFPVEGDVRAFGVFNPVTGKIEEKSAMPKSNLVCVGIYAFPANAQDLARQLRSSARGELEITDLLNIYAGTGNLDFATVSRDWMDCETFDCHLRAGISTRYLRKV
jgi:glucose-1-phosphate thymidylyltransferase